MTGNFGGASLMEFDKIIRMTVDDKTVEYGFIFGNERIVFIKAGAGGTVLGYKNKYLRMALCAHEALGATVICSSNPVECTDVDREIIAWCTEHLGLSGFELNPVGTSDGAAACITLAQIPETRKLLCINPSFVPGRDPKEGFIPLSDVEKIIVYGTKDAEGRKIIPVLKEADIPKLEIITVEGADHRFTDMIDEYVKLIDLI